MKPLRMRSFSATPYRGVELVGGDFGAVERPGGDLGDRHRPDDVKVAVEELSDSGRLIERPGHAVLREPGSQGKVIESGRRRGVAIGVNDHRLFLAQHGVERLAAATPARPSARVFPGMSPLHNPLPGQPVGVFHLAAPPSTASSRRRYSSLEAASVNSIHGGSPAVEPPGPGLRLRPTCAQSRYKCPRRPPLSIGRMFAL